MSGYLLTPAADADLEEIWQYVSESGGVSRANALEEELHTAMERLGAFPDMGHARATTSPTSGSASGRSLGS